MAYPVTVKIVTEKKIALSIDDAAEWFSGLTDDEQSKFFVAVTEHAKAWPGTLSQGEQWYRIGGHLRNCECSTDEARDMIREIHNGLLHSNHK